MMGGPRPVDSGVISVLGERRLGAAGRDFVGVCVVVSDLTYHSRGRSCHGERVHPHLAHRSFMLRLPTKFVWLSLHLSRHLEAFYCSKVPPALLLFSQGSSEMLFQVELRYAKNYIMLSPLLPNIAADWTVRILSFLTP